MKVIDIHTHVFNLRYLPVAGILSGSGLVSLPPRLARAIAVVALALTKKDESLDGDSGSKLAEARINAEVEKMEAALQDFDAYVADVEDEVPPEVLNDPDLRAELAEIEASGDGDALKKGWLGRLIAKAKSYLDYGGRAMDWVFAVLTQRERVIARLLARTFPETQLFVHHMMDMKDFYTGGNTKYDFAPRQIERMERLAKSEGRLATFVAWNPFRSDGLDVVKDALLNHNCIGVKVYPPSGYRPVGNTDADYPPHPNVQPPPPDTIEKRNLELFEWCAAEQVPVFTHCTPEGFEAYDHAGKNGAPTYWRRLLDTNERLRELRLCLGHAGGGDWFSTDEIFNGPTSYPRQVFDLCTSYPNVYCEVGILDEVADAGSRQIFGQRFTTLIGAKREFAKRILYGSDWHMLYIHIRHQDFYANYRKLFSEAGLDAYVEDFFSGNALSYLGKFAPASTT